MITNRLYNRLKLPYRITRGSFAYRQSGAANFTKQIVSNLSGQINDKHISLSKFGKLLKKMLPKNLSTCVMKNKETKADAKIGFFINNNKDFLKYAIFLKVDKNKPLNILDIPTLAHEIRHLADYLFHPKILSREQLATKTGLEEGKFLKFYDTNIYVKELFFCPKHKKRIIKNIRRQTRKILRGLSTENKFNLMQYMRYNLITELNAYRQEAKTAKKLNYKNIKVYEDERFPDFNKFMFEEKIKLLTDMTFEIIKKERGIHKAKIKRLKNKTGKF